MKHFNLSLALALSTLPLSCSRSGPAPHDDTQILSWEQPDEAFRIGRGYDPESLEPVRGDCLMHPEQYLESNWADARGIKADITETRITSKEQLYKELNLSVNARARYGAFGGSGSYAQYEKFTSSEDGFTWLYNLKVAIGSKTLQTERISLEGFKPEAQQLIRAAQAGDEQAKRSFYRMCGSKFVRGVRLGGAISEVLEVSSKATDTVRSITAKLKASYGSGPFQVSGNAALSSLFDSAEKSSFLKREISQTGGETIEFDLTDANVGTKIDAYVAAIKQQNAAVIEVEMIDWSTLLNFTPSDPIDVARSIRMEQLLRQLWRYQDNLNRIDTYIYLYEHGVYSLSDADVARLRASYSEVTEALDSVIEVGKSCFLDAATCGKAIKQVVVALPQPTLAPQAKERLYQTTHWQMLFPAEGAKLETLQQAGVTSWRFDEKIIAADRAGHAIPLHVDLFEVACANILELFPFNQKQVFASFQGEPIFYTESTGRYPQNKARYAASFGFKSQAYCLQIQVWSDPVDAIDFSLEDASPLSRSLRRFASSVQTLQLGE